MECKACLSLSYGEIALKKDNRRYFETKLERNIREMLKGIEFEMKKDQSKIMIYGEELEEMKRRLQKVFGIVYISLQRETTKDMDAILATAEKVMEEELSEREFQTFKVESKRSDKSFPFQSPEISQRVGGHILRKFPQVKVDVHHPDRIIRVDIKQKAYVSGSRIRGLGGMPVGSNGRVLCLLSGGIDSPVAALLAMKRGLDVDFLHFHSHPFTSRRALEKTKDLAKLVAEYGTSARFYSLNLLPVQEAIGKHCDETYTTLLQRRSMIRLAERIARADDRTALVTGENLGQVASQTLEGMSVVDPVTDMMILRPLLCFDKTEIVELARAFGTFETSILPYEDCCTVFVSKHPKTRPVLAKVEEEERKIPFLELEEEVFQNQEYTQIK
ncbi:MAG: tRNA uracil 4-sulfurtransferase ThiI [Tissierellia bacterium]|nr:tRNA uracil 4-sulfurtransferase ThiI [Tissierellia bacterium]